MRWLVAVVLFLLALGVGRLVGCNIDIWPDAPCEGVVCPPDDNECTSEGCSNFDGRCESWPAPDGESCNFDGLPGVCIGGVCEEDPCLDLVCDDGNECTVDTCDSVEAACDFPPVVCDDDNPCTEDSCDPVTGCNHAAYPDGTECGCLYRGGDCGPWICIGFCEPCHCSRYEYCRNGECGPEGSGGRGGAGGTGGMGGSAG